MSVENKFYRLRSCIAIVYSEGHLEFFDSNQRTGFSINLQYSGIVDLLHSLNGFNSINSILKKFPDVATDELIELISFLHQKRVLIEVDENYDEYLLSKFPRLINTLEGYFKSVSEVNKAIQRGVDSNILIIGLGAVGTWVLHCLIKSGIKKISVIDDDCVEESNLHRQDLFFEADVGLKKVFAAQENIKKSYGIEINAICKKMLSVKDLEELNSQPDLIINCADSPSVDATSKIVSEFCLKRKINHIIGGGYNLHLTLVGQVVIPGVTACFHCFEKVLTPLNASELYGVKKLQRNYRKIGSLGPVCAISASITATEAIKLIFGVPIDFISLTNKRLELNLNNFELGSFKVERNNECEYC